MCRRANDGLLPLGLHVKLNMPMEADSDVAGKSLEWATPSALLPGTGHQLGAGLG